MTEYVFSNTNYLFTQIKHNIRDCERGALTREQAAYAIRELCKKLEERTEDLPELTLDEVREHVKEHVARNKTRERSVAQAALDGSI